jgi:hypothetical protein
MTASVVGVRKRPRQGYQQDGVSPRAAVIDTATEHQPKGNTLSHEPRRARRRLWAGLAALLAIPAGLAAVAPAAAAAGSNTLTVTAGEYAYQLKGSLKAGWTEIHFVNSGNEAHMMAVNQLKKGVTAAQLKKVVLSNDPSAGANLFVGDPSQGVSGMPQLLSPKQQTTTITELKPGHYGILCFVPAASDGKPHAAHGMIKTFDVTTSKSSLKPPKDGVVDVTLNDTGITVPSPTAPRHITAKVTNEGQAPHSFAIVKIETGKTLDEVKAYYDAFFAGTKPSDTPPGLLVGGVSTIAPGGMAYTVLDLAAGHYGYVSTEGDNPATDDYTKGLHGEFDVK